MSRPMLSVPSRKPPLPGACNGMPTGSSGSSGARSGTATATTVTTNTNATAAQLSSTDDEGGGDNRRSRPRNEVPGGMATAISARLPLDAGDLMRAARPAFQADVEFGVGARGDGDRAAGVEGAAGRRRQRAGGFAGQDS